MKISVLLLTLCLIACNTNKTIQTPTPPELSSITNHKAKNIILLIGDGMGIGQLTAGTYSNGNTSHFERFPVIGLHKPYSGDNLITDSAAAATSFATGFKTFNGAIAVDLDTLPVKTILEEAEQKGLKTGLVATSTIVHATPASFIAHNESRRNYEEIAADFLDTEVDYFVGGGKKFFDRREDERNLVDELTAKGYTMGNYLTELDEFFATSSDASKIGYLTADADPLPAAQGRDYLKDAAMYGINFLEKRSDNGFFIMIEGSQIDWGGHANNSDYIVTEFLDFNEAIGRVLDWAEEDGETLVVVTADHETGGYTIQPGSTQDSIVTSFTTKKHSGDFINVFAYGPGSEKFGGIYNNTDIYEKMREAYGWEKRAMILK
jgi:alkaline phosphatase